MINYQLYAKMGFFSKGNGTAQDGDPHKLVDNQLFCKSQGSVGEIAYKNVGKGQSGHEEEEKGTDVLFDFIEHLQQLTPP